jgi:DNA modification methylase
MRQGGGMKRNRGLPVEPADVKAAYTTAMGAAYCGDSRRLLASLPDDSVHLVITSPPFALLREKEYGNKNQIEYVDWLCAFAEVVFRKLREDGSFVLDLGGAYERGSPTRSLYNFRIPIRLCDELGFVLAEDFYWHNPSKLPSPIEWVNKRKLRVKDSVNTVWWFGKTPWAKANAANVLTEYSQRMKTLIKDPEAFYDAAKRPSGHDVSMRFGKDNGGAIPPNLLQIPNTESNGQYIGSCKAIGIKPHPARFPARLPEFFIRFLTDPGDTVVDVFSGSNTTGMVAQQLGRHWLAFDNHPDYVAASAFRFVPKGLAVAELREIYTAIESGRGADLSIFDKQMSLF